MHTYRSHTCAGLMKDHVGHEVRLSGWVHRVRDHGGVLFIDLRAEDMLMNAPSEPTLKQLRELNLRVVPKDS